MNKMFFPSWIYHVCNRSIAHFKIFKYENEFNRFLSLIEYYNHELKIPYSTYNKHVQRFNPQGLMYQNDPLVVKILGYCIMPDHYHLIIKTIMDNDQIVKYLSKIENAYAMYFNSKTKRHGHLWAGSFKSVHVSSEEQLLYLTKYVHRNPLKSKLVNNIDDWRYSSFRDYQNINIMKNLKPISIRDPKLYRDYVLNRIKHDKLSDLDRDKIQIDL